MRTICWSAILTIAFVLMLPEGARPIERIGFRTDEFSFVLPLGWQEIPREIIDEQARRVSEAIGGQPVTRIDYCFQEPDDEFWFRGSYLTILINKSGRLSDKDLEEADTLTKIDIERICEEELIKVFESIDIGDMYFDKQSYIVWTKGRTSSQYGDLTITAALMMTEVGYIQFNLYSTSSSLSDVAALFAKIVDTVEIAEEFRYKPREEGTIARFLGDLKWRTRLTNALKYAAFGCVVSIVLHFYRKRKNGLTP